MKKTESENPAPVQPPPLPQRLASSLPGRMLAAVLLMLILGTQASQAVIVGTFNIRYENEKDAGNGNGWAQRAPVIASLVRFHRFDVLGIQEALGHQVADLQAQLPAYAHSGCGRDDGKEGGEFAAIFYRKDVFTLRDGGTFWLSPTPEVPSTGWDAKFHRICTWVKLESVKTHETLFVFNTHFDHHGTVARLESARLTVARIKEIANGRPAVLTGDFNVDQSSESYREIHESGVLEDAFETAAERYALNGTPNGFKVTTYTDRRIDHVFHTRGFKALRYGVLTDSYRTPVDEVSESGPAALTGEHRFRSYLPRTPSDHFPVLVELE